jgi:hypothetical protein
MSAHFTICDVEPAAEPFLTRSTRDWFSESLEHPLAVVNSSAQKLVIRSDIGFWEALKIAFNHHYPVSLSPDHLWFLVCRGAAHHAALNAQPAPSSGDPLSISLAREDREACAGAVAALVAQEARRRLGAEMGDLFAQRFSTSGDMHDAIFSAGMLDAALPHLRYSVTMCGIPSVTLEGEQADWRALRDRVDGLRRHGLGWWVDALMPLLEQFVQASGGHVDRDFWQNMFHYEMESGYEGVDGWFVCFSPYVKTQVHEYPGHTREEVEALRASRDAGDQERWRSIMRSARVRTVWQRNPHVTNADGARTRIETGALLPSNASTALKVNGRHAMRCWAGFMGVSQDAQTLAVRPELMWAVLPDVLKKTPWYSYEKATTRTMLEAERQAAARWAAERDAAPRRPGIEANSDSSGHIASLERSSRTPSPD